MINARVECIFLTEKRRKVKIYYIICKNGTTNHTFCTKKTARDEPRGFWMVNR